MNDTIFVTLKGPEDNFEDIYKQVYENGKTNAYQHLKNHDINFKKTIKMLVHRNMIGSISKKYGGDQECFRALGIIYAMAKESSPESGIDKIAEDTFEKMYKNMIKYENMTSDYAHKITDEDRRRHVLDFKYLDSQFDMIVNDGAEQILGIINV